MIKIQSTDEKLNKAFEIISSQNNLWAHEKKCMEITGDEHSYIVKLDDGTAYKYNRRNDVIHALAEYFCGVKISTDKVFDKFGIMIDCARNAVPSVDGLKRFITLIAQLGYNYIGLYLEDCFEVENEPYFGYMRGRYSREELKEIVDYAELFGIEVIPYIQTLAHLYNIFHHWEEYFDKCRDIHDILLMDCDRTYILIDNMLKTVADTFKSKHVHIGMDEAFMMTYGKYRKLHDGFDRNEVFMRHVNKVVSICDKYGLEPYAWGDMFLKHANREGMPKGLSLTAWEYVQTDEKYYSELIEKLKSLTDNVEVSTAGHKWYGYAPLNEYSIKSVDAAVEGAENKTDSLCVTLWGDDGSECSYNAVLYTIMRTANKVLKNKLQEKELDITAKYLTGYSMDELLALDLPNKVFNVPMNKAVNVSKYLLFEDILMGISDRNENYLYEKYFVENAKVLNKLAKKTSDYNYLYEEMARLCEVLAVKGTLRLQLITAYKNGDKKRLKEIANVKIPVTIKRIKKLKDTVENTWLKENKTQGFEIQNIRLGALIERLGFCRRYLNRYINGEINKIEELEIDLSPKVSEDEYNGAMCFNSYEQNVTYGIISFKHFS